MRKILVLLMSICLLVGCQSSSQVEVTYDRPEGLVEIDYDSLKEKIDSPTDFLLYIGRPDCSDCEMFEPYLQEYLESHEGSGIYYLNIKSFRDAAYADDASEEEKDFYDNMKEYLGFAWTPTLMHYSNGKSIDEYEFLDSSFGRNENEVEKNEALKEFVKEFHTWMNENLKENK